MCVAGMLGSILAFDQHAALIGGVVALAVQPAAQLLAFDLRRGLVDVIRLATTP